MPGFANSSQIPMNRRNSPKSIAGPLILLLVPTRIISSTKKLGRKRTKAVSKFKILVNYLFITSNFDASRWQSITLLWYTPFHLHTYLQIGWSVLPLVLGFFSFDIIIFCHQLSSHPLEDHLYPIDYLHKQEPHRHRIQPQSLPTTNSPHYL